MTAKADAVEGGGLGEPPPPAAAGDGDPRRRTGTALAIGGRGEEEEEEEAPPLRPLGRAIAICFVLSCLCLSLPPVRGYNILSYSRVVVSMLCHGELAARRREPRRPRDPDTPESRPGGGRSIFHFPGPQGWESARRPKRPYPIILL